MIKNKNNVFKFLDEKEDTKGLVFWRLIDIAIKLKNKNLVKKLAYMGFNKCYSNESKMMIILALADNNETLLSKKFLDIYLKQNRNISKNINIFQHIIKVYNVKQIKWIQDYITQKKDKK